MPTLLQVGAVAMCPHAGQLSIISSNTRVLLGGMPAATAGDNYLIAGCPFTLPNGKPQPCMTTRWLVPSLRVKVNGQPAVLQSSTGLCNSAEQIPGGPPSIVATQPRVQGQ